jgi:hypothetical protein
MTGVHRGASQDVPLVCFFFLDAGGLRRAALWSSGAAALLHRLHYCTGCTLPLLGLVAQEDWSQLSAVVRVMQNAQEIRYSTACAGASGAVFVLSLAALHTRTQLA